MLREEDEEEPRCEIWVKKVRAASSCGEQEGEQRSVIWGVFTLFASEDILPTIDLDVACFSTPVSLRYLNVFWWGDRWVKVVCYLFCLLFRRQEKQEREASAEKAQDGVVESLKSFFFRFISYFCFSGSNELCWDGNYDASNLLIPQIKAPFLVKSQFISSDRV